MTLKELKAKMNICTCVRGMFSVGILYRGSWNYSHSNNTLAYDVIKSEEPSSFYTIKQAYQALWDEVARKMKREEWECIN